MKSGTSTTPEMIHDPDFKYVYSLDNKHKKMDDPNIKKLYHFLQSLVTVNHNHYDMINSNNKGLVMNKSDKENLLKHIQKTFNCGEFKFTNIAILDSIIYHDNARGKELRPFRISADVFINKEPIGKITLHIEMFIRMDSMFYGPIKSGFPTITRIKLVRKDKISSSYTQIEEEPEESGPMTDNSLIPDEIQFSTDGSDMMSDDDSESYLISTDNSN